MRWWAGEGSPPLASYEGLTPGAKVGVIAKKRMKISSVLVQAEMAGSERQMQAAKLTAGLANPVAIGRGSGVTPIKSSCPVRSLVLCVCLVSLLQPLENCANQGRRSFWEKPSGRGWCDEAKARRATEGLQASERGTEAGLISRPRRARCKEQVVQVSDMLRQGSGISGKAVAWRTGGRCYTCAPNQQSQPPRSRTNPVSYYPTYRMNTSPNDPTDCPS